MSAGKKLLQKIGADGENEVVHYLCRNGYQIIERNWRIKAGEIDIIAREENSIVFIEVKTRSSNSFGTPFDAITPDKAFRLQRLALAWMTINHRWGQEFRIDVAGVWPLPNGDFHIEIRKAVL